MEVLPHKDGFVLGIGTKELYQRSLATSTYHIAVPTQCHEIRLHRALHCTALYHRSTYIRCIYQPSNQGEESSAALATPAAASVSEPCTASRYPPACCCCSRSLCPSIIIALCSWSSATRALRKSGGEHWRFAMAAHGTPLNHGWSFTASAPPIPHPSLSSGLNASSCTGNTA